MASSNIQYALLGLIAARPSGIHGYKLKQEIEAVSSREFWEINFGSLYRVLDGLEAERSIEALAGDVNDRPTRRVFRITEKGRRSLDDWLLQPPGESPRPLRDELALKLLFMGHERIDVLAGQIRRQRSIYMGHLHRLLRNQRRLELAGLDPGVTGLVMEGAKSRLLADLDWLDTVERSLLRQASV